MRVALVYDRINKIGGAEAVLIQFAKMYPDADWFTSVWDPKRAPFSKNWNVKTSWVNKIPLLKTRHEWIPFIMPFIFEAFDFSTYDLVISIGSAECKGIITSPSTVHINYCLTPTRYLYSHKEEYLSNSIYRWVAKYLRKWDLVASTRPDEMIAISTHVKKRIQNIYNRVSMVIYPPVDTQKFRTRSSFSPPFSNYFLTVARLVPYKKIDILVKAFNDNGKTLVIIGTGSELPRLTKLARNNIHLLGCVPEDALVGFYQNCQAFLQANEEDFGISMVEAQAAGKPVIAYKEGGASDIVIDGKTGILIESSSVDGFNQAIDTLATLAFDSKACQINAERFNLLTWETNISERIKQVCQTNQK